MQIVLSTERLLLRLFDERDAPLLFDLNKDPDVIRYTHDPMVNLEQAEKILNEVILPQYNLYDHGRWAVHLKDSLDFLGWCGLKFNPEDDEIDLGYRFKKQYWGNGYATESAMGSINYGFGQLGISEIVGKAIPGNKDSIHVLEKCGMNYCGEGFSHGHLHKIYKIYNPSIPSENR
jgi:ribosomal-protein-alanine N-acetyltransferase